MSDKQTATLDEETIKRWIGKTAEYTDTIHLRSAQLMQSTLDREQTINHGDPLPLGWHWLYFLESKKMSDLGRDGHAALGEFLPPVALPRRMWAGSRLEFLNPIFIGDIIRKVSTIKNITIKSGKSGKLCFVTLLHEFWRETEKLIKEEQDIVYREDPAPNTNPPVLATAPNDADATRVITPSPTLLFRYSALTFNGHRIHYDIDYCRDVEGYPGLIFHGPLSATLLLDLFSSKVGAKNIRRFEFRALSPLFADKPFTINFKKSDDIYSLWAATPDGKLAIQASGY